MIHPTRCTCLGPKQHWQLVCTACWNAVPSEMREEYQERCRAQKQGFPSWYAARNRILKHAERESDRRRKAEREAAVR